MESRGKRSVVASGKTVDDAIANGLTILGVRRDQVDVQILHPGSRGLLGIGAEDARVQLVVQAPPVPAGPPPAERVPVEPVVRDKTPRDRVDRGPRPPIARDVPPEPVKPAGVTAEAVTPTVVTPEPVVEHSAPQAAETDAAQVGREVLTDLLKRMGFQASVDAYVGTELGDEGEEPPLVLNLRGDDLGILIGRRGETLAALQYLVRLMVSHRIKHWTDILVDVESYRSRRRRALESLAARVAERVVASGHTQALEPMPAYERRIVHMALRNHPRVMTQSVGVGERRKVTIVPK